MLATNLIIAFRDDPIEIISDSTTSYLDRVKAINYMKSIVSKLDTAERQRLYDALKPARQQYVHTGMEARVVSLQVALCPPRKITRKFNFSPEINWLDYADWKTH